MTAMSSLVERIEGTVMAVNSYLIHGSDGVVVVDGQLTIADAQAVRAAVDTTGVPLAGVVITHPHPDHYAGAGLIAGPDVPIVATEAVEAVIRRDDVSKNEIVGPMMGDQRPAERRFPDWVVTSGDVVTLAGLDLMVRDVGLGESHADSIWSIDDAWFVGDLLCPDMDAYLADGHYEAWLASITQLRHDAPGAAVFYGGHGMPTNRGGIAAQHEYITAFVESVAAGLSADPEERRVKVVDHMSTLVSDHRLQFLMELSIEPLAAILRASADTP